MEEVNPDRVVFYSDSAAALSIITSKSTRDDILIEIYTAVLNLERLRVDIQFCWTPAHIGIVGEADKLAKIKKLEKLKKIF